MNYYYFIFWNVLKCIQLNVLEMNHVFVCHGSLFSSRSYLEKQNYYFSPKTHTHHLPSLKTKNITQLHNLPSLSLPSNFILLSKTKKSSTFIFLFLLLPFPFSPPVSFFSLFTQSRRVTNSSSCCHSSHIWPQSLFLCPFTVSILSTGVATSRHRCVFIVPPLLASEVRRLSIWFSLFPLYWRSLQSSSWRPFSPFNVLFWIWISMRFFWSTFMNFGIHYGCFVHLSFYSLFFSLDSYLPSNSYMCWTC